MRICLITCKLRYAYHSYIMNVTMSDKLIKQIYPFVEAKQIDKVAEILKTASDELLGQTGCWLIEILSGYVSYDPMASDADKKLVLDIFDRIIPLTPPSKYGGQAADYVIKHAAPNYDFFAKVNNLPSVTLGALKRNYTTLLQDLAVVNNDPRIVDYLVSRGADPNYEKDPAWTPLFWAGRNGNLKFAIELIRQGADPHINDDLILEQAVYHNEIDAVKYLLDHSLVEKPMNIKIAFDGRETFNDTDSALVEYLIAKGYVPTSDDLADAISLSLMNQAKVFSKHVALTDTEIRRVAQEIKTSYPVDLEDFREGAYQSLVYLLSLSKVWGTRDMIASIMSNYIDYESEEENEDESVDSGVAKTAAMAVGDPVIDED